MATPIQMPRQGQSVETCIISSWHFKKGDEVKEGDLILSYETDKASFDLEAPVSGRLLEVFFDEGEEVPVLINIAVIGQDGEATDEFHPDGSNKTSKGESESVVPVETENASKPVQEGQATLFGSSGEQTSAIPGESLPDLKLKKRISPRARKMAAILKINTDTLTGSGPNGRIIADDIIKASESASPESRKTDSVSGSGNEYSEHKLSNLRKIIAEKMYVSLQQSAQLTHHISADARKILSYRASFKSLPEGSPNRNITINDMICYAVTRVLLGKKYINSHFLGDNIRIFNGVHLGFAVDTERGLMVPVLRDADTCTLTDMSGKLKKLAQNCKQGSIDPELLQSNAASFTVSNLGAYGIEMFTPVLNLPQTGILGINTITKKPADLGDGLLGFVPSIGLSLTYDHRAVDGAPASAFLASLKEYIESFEPVIG